MPGMTGLRGMSVILGGTKNRADFDDGGSARPAEFQCPDAHADPGSALRQGPEPEYTRRHSFGECAARLRRFIPTSGEEKARSRRPMAGGISHHGCSIWASTLVGGVKPNRDTCFSSLSGDANPRST